jgi:polar amino acid transport system substrate-binding protein
MIFCTRLLPFAMLGLLLLPDAAQAAKDELVFCYEETDIRPWQTKTGTGLSFDLLNEVSIRTKTKFSYVARPWKRCLHEVKTNQVDGAIGVSWKTDRLDIGAYPGDSGPDASRAMHIERYVVIRKKNSSVNWDGIAFSNLSAPVGTQFGYSAVDNLKALNIPVDDGARGAHELLTKLKQNRIAAAVLLGGEANSLFAEHEGFRTDLEILSKPLVEKPYYLMLSHDLAKKNGAQSESLWNTISKVKQSAAYQEKQKRTLNGAK